MWNGTIMKKLAAVLSVMMLGTMFTGCGKDSENIQNDVPVGKGRFVEQEVALPEGVAAAEIAQLLRRDGKLHLLVKKEAEGVATFQEWQLSEGSFSEVTSEFLKQISIPYMEYGMNKLLYGNDGSCYFYATSREQEEEDTRGHLWKSGDGVSLEEITPKNWQVPDETYGYYSSPQDIVLLDSGVLVSNFYFKLELYQGADGSLIREVIPDINNFQEKVVSSGEKYYLLPTNDLGKMSGINVYSPDSDVAEKTMEVDVESTLSSAYLDVLPDGTLVLFNGDGLFRSQTGESWETVIEGVDTTMAMVNNWCKGMIALEDGSYYALFGGEDGDNALVQYVYDPEAVVAVQQTLNLYTVKDSFLLQQAAAAFHRAHPEVVVKIETAITRDQMYDTSIDYQQIFQNLNTRLLSGNGPDVLVMDNLNMDSFIEKGMLVDINDVVKPMEEDGTLLSNVTGAYVREDGSRYVVPLQFGLVLAVGRQVDVEQMSDMPSLAQALSRTQESLMGPHTPYELADKFLPYFLGNIVNGKTLDKEALKENLEYLKAIGDNCGIITSRGEDERPWSVWDLSSKAKLAFNQVDGFNQAMTPISVANFVKGSYVPFANAFYPSLQVGIYTKTEKTDLAKEFIAFMMSEEIQSHDYYEGFPVNEASLITLAAKDRSDAEAYTMIDVGEGLAEEFHIKSYSQEDAEKLMDTCRQVTNIALKDDVVLEQLSAALAGYLDGSQTLEATVDKIDGGLRMYLAE